MTYFICDYTSDELFSAQPEMRFTAERLMKAPFNSSKPLTPLRDEMPYGISKLCLPAHVLVPSANRKLKTDSFEFHVCTQKLPLGAFWRITPEVYAASPELTFIQMANHLSLAELIALGYEYCGTYAISPTTGIATFDLPPLTNSRRLMHFIESCPPMRGISRARTASKYVHDNSASPMETILHIRFVLPGPMGGYHLPTALLNHRIELNERACNIYHRESCRCDLFFPKIGLDVEYNGVEYHRFKADDDAARQNALATMGYGLTTITKSQLNDPKALGEIARHIAKLHGKEVRNASFEWTVARQLLRDSLYMYLKSQNRKMNPPNGVRNSSIPLP